MKKKLFIIGALLLAVVLNLFPVLTDNKDVSLKSLGLNIARAEDPDEYVSCTTIVTSHTRTEHDCDGGRGTYGSEAWTVECSEGNTGACTEGEYGVDWYCSYSTFIESRSWDNTSHVTCN